jgi:AcrR family transcriptional regulator
MQTEAVSPSPAGTRQRLLDAAARIFARDGLTGATTRAIAQEAGVNEVTLFRHFQSKDRLLAAVVGRNFGPESDRARTPLPQPTANLRDDLRELARRYEELLNENLPLVRTMLGEIHHHHPREQERQVFHGIFRPIKEALFTRIKTAMGSGELGSHFAPDVLADLFAGMIFTGVIRRASSISSQLRLEYSASSYLEATVELVLRGGAPSKMS